MATETVRKFQYYQILEVSRRATQQEVDASYRRLANQNHPDKNPDPKANELFKKINQAYQVIGNSKLRAEYDKSPAECPDCWTYEVIQTAFPYWRCRHCGCQFNPAAPSEIKRFSQSAIPETLRKKLELFSSTQCSCCSKFYTQPFLCPQDKLTSNCLNFTELNQQERDKRLEDEKWRWRISDMLDQSIESELLARCRNPQCAALNPNPKTSTCWRCKQNTLRCPSPECEAKPLLMYDIDSEKWKCPSNSCRKTFAFVKQPAVEKKSDLELSEEVCPKDKSKLYFDSLLLLWSCSKCKRTYTYQELKPRPHAAKATDAAETEKQDESGPKQSQEKSQSQFSKDTTSVETKPPVSHVFNTGKLEHSSFWEDFKKMVVGKQAQSHQQQTTESKSSESNKEDILRKNENASKQTKQRIKRKIYLHNLQYSRRIREAFSRLYILLVGLLGALILYIGFLPVLQNSSNQQVIKLWWGAIWSFGDLSDYLRGIGAVIAAVLIAGGLLGILIAPFKRHSATRFVFLGGLAGLMLLGALWSGLLNGSLRVLFIMGFGGAKTALYDSLSGGIPKVFSHNQKVVEQLLKYGWLKNLSCWLRCVVRRNLAFLNVVAETKIADKPHPRHLTYTEED